jgi:hypothetical protein
VVAAKRLNLLPSKQQQEAVSERERERERESVCVCVTRKQTQFFVQNQLRSSSRLEELQTLKKLELEREEANQAGFV